MPADRPLRIAFAGDRDIAVAVLDHLLAQGVAPVALLVADPGRATHADELVRRCEFLEPSRILVGPAFREPAGLELLSQLDLDYLVCVHFHFIVPEAVLRVPAAGVLNLHPSYLPYNRGWHTAVWALLDGTPAGATLHFMDAGLDTGDIVHQREVVPSPGDTAQTLYERIKRVELEVFQEAWPAIAARTFERRRQPESAGTAHKRQDIATRDMQRLDLDAPTTARAVLHRLRALTTNRMEEAAYFEEGGRRYRVQVVVRGEE